MLRACGQSSLPTPSLFTAVNLYVYAFVAEYLFRICMHCIWFCCHSNPVLKGFTKCSGFHHLSMLSYDKHCVPLLTIAVTVPREFDHLIALYNLLKVQLRILFEGTWDFTLGAVVRKDPYPLSTEENLWYSFVFLLICQPILSDN